MPDGKDSIFTRCQTGRTVFLRGAGWEGQYFTGCRMGRTVFYTVPDGKDSILHGAGWEGQYFTVKISVTYFVQKVMHVTVVRYCDNQYCYACYNAGFSCQSMYDCK